MSNDCKNVPIELILGTTDSKIYDAKNNKWLWDGQLYWAVECMPHGQYTVSDRVAPEISAEQYLPFGKSPMTWNYCKSKQCNPRSNVMLIVFTFNPNSTNPNDYMQYAVDINCNVTDFPHHFIHDNSGNELYIDIVEVSKMVHQPYVEIWIAKSNASKDNDLSQIDKHVSIDDKSPTTKTFPWLIVIIAIILILLIVGIILFIRHNPTISTQASNIY